MKDLFLKRGLTYMTTVCAVVYTHKKNGFICIHLLFLLLFTP